MFGFALEIVILILLILFNGLLAMSEMAVVSARRARLHARAEAGDEGARTALQLAQEPTRFLSTVQAGITLIAILSGAFGGASVANHISKWLLDLGLSTQVSDTLSVILVVATITYVSLVFGELVPKRLALHSPDVIASRVARPMQQLARISSPLVTVLSFSTNAVLRVLSLRSEQRLSVTEEEIRAMIGISAESGTVAEEEAELLDRVFHFGDRRVHEVMIPRTEAVWLARDSRVSDFFEVYAQTPHSRFPIFDESPDQVTGILGIKDVLAAIARGEIDNDSPIEPLARRAMFVPETKLIGALFREMQARGVQMAIAVDEFGGTAGIVTLEQLLEEMVGQMRDELRPGEVEITAIDERTSQVEGTLSVEEARDELGIDIPEGHYDTIAGWVLDQLGHIPTEGEVLNVEGCRITVAEMKGPKIEQLRVVRV